MAVSDSAHGRGRAGVAERLAGAGSAGGGGRTHALVGWKSGAGCREGSAGKGKQRAETEEV